MSSEFVEIAKIRFRGLDYEKSMLDAVALKEVIHLQEVLYKSIEINNFRTYGVESRLTSEEKNRHRLFLGQVAHGSAIAPIHVQRDNRQDLLGKPAAHEVVEESMLKIHAIIKATENDEQFPPNTKRELLGVLNDFGSSLSKECALEISVRGEEWVTMTMRYHARIAGAMASPYTDTVSLQGQVLEADVKMRRFTLWPREDQKVRVEFTDDQETKVTTALKDHREVEVQVTGTGKFNPDGKLVEISGITKLRLVHAEDSDYDPNAKPIWETIKEIGESMPDEFWDQYPRDLSENHDFYLSNEKTDD